MSDTLGALVDKLGICNIKLFMVQDRVHKAAAAGEGLDADTVGMLATLNLQRNSLMSEIDESFHDGIKTGQVEVDPRVKVVDV